MGEAREIIGVVVTRVPLLLTGIASGALRLLFGSRRAAWSFKRTLRKNGMDRRQARVLARQYRRQTDVMKILRQFIRERGRSGSGFRW